MRKVAIFLIISHFDQWSKCDNDDKFDKNELSIIKKLSKETGKKDYIYNIASFHFQNRDFCVKDTDGQNTRGGKKMPPAGISLRPSKELDSHGKKLVKQLVSRKVNIWKETERH